MSPVPEPSRNGVNDIRDEPSHPITGPPDLSSDEDLEDPNGDPNALGYEPLPQNADLEVS